MRSDTVHSVSDGEYEKYDCDATHQAHSRREHMDHVERHSAMETQLNSERSSQGKNLYPKLPASPTGIPDSADPKDDDNDMDIAESEQPLHERERSGSTSSSTGEDGHAGEDSRLAHRKIFVGGLNWQTTEADLREYFGQFGAIQSCQIKYDVASKQPRGFGFVVFEQEESVTHVLSMRDQHRVRGKRVDPKPAKPSKDVSRKVFVGGLDPSATYEQILGYFSQFGKVESLDLPFDNAKSLRKNYVFIAYATKHEALAATRSPKQLICGRMCDVRIAVPRDQILKMQSRANVASQPLKFAAPQSMMPSAYAYPRNYSAPAGSLAPVASPAPLCGSLPTQTDVPYVRYRAPYRSEPGGCSVPQFAPQVPQVAPAVTQPSPPFHFALQNTQSAMNGQFTTPYQFCMVDQQQTPMYAQYCAVAPECAVQPSVIAMPTYSAVMVGGGNPSAGLMQPLVSPTYNYQPYAGQTELSSPATVNVFPVATSSAGEPLNSSDVLQSEPPQMMAANSVSPVQHVQYSAAQSIMPMGVTCYVQANPSACMQPMFEPTMSQINTYNHMAHDNFDGMSSSSRKRPPNV